jgi:hypothetical protein
MVYRVDFELKDRVVSILILEDQVIQQGKIDSAKSNQEGKQGRKWRYRIIL